MAVKGTIAKDKVMEAIRNAFDTDFIGVYDKKGYVWVDDGGSKVQVAISLTCPKTPVGEVPVSGLETAGGINFEESTAIGVDNFTPADFTEEEMQKIDSLVERLGLS